MDLALPVLELRELAGNLAEAGNCVTSHEHQILHPVFCVAKYVLHHRAPPAAVELIAYSVPVRGFRMKGGTERMTEGGLKDLVRREFSFHLDRILARFGQEDSLCPNALVPLARSPGDNPQQILQNSPEYSHSIGPTSPGGPCWALRAHEHSPPVFFPGLPFKVCWLVMESLFLVLRHIWKASIRSILTSWNIFLAW